MYVPEYLYKRESEPLELELQAFLSKPMWVQELKPEPLQEQQMPLTTKLSFQPLSLF